MSKKMLKRSLALGALMAFVITGSAMAADSSVLLNGNSEEFIGTSIEVNRENTTGQAVCENDRRSYALGVLEGDHTINSNLQVVNNLEGYNRNYGIVVTPNGQLTLKGNVGVTVGGAVVTDNGTAGRYVGVRKNGSWQNDDDGSRLTIDKDLTININVTDAMAVGLDTWNGITKINGNAKINVEAPNFWTSGVQVGYHGELEFNGNETEIKTSTTKSTSTAQGVALLSESREVQNQTITIGDAKVIFNSNKTTISVTSDHGATGIAAQDSSHQAIFKKGEVLIDIDLTKSGHTNAIGVLSAISVQDNVNKFTVDVNGSGSTNSTVNGTAGLYAVNGRNMQISAKETNIIVNGWNKEWTDDDERSNTYGIRVFSDTAVTIDNCDTLKVIVKDNVDEKNAYSLYADGNNAGIGITADKANIQGIIKAVNGGVVDISGIQDLVLEGLTTSSDAAIQVEGGTLKVNTSETGTLAIEGAKAGNTYKVVSGVADKEALWKDANLAYDRTAMFATTNLADKLYTVTYTTADKMTDEQKEAAAEQIVEAVGGKEELAVPRLVGASAGADSIMQETAKGASQFLGAITNDAEMKPETKAAVINSAAQLAEVGGNAGTAASVASNVSNVTTSRMSFSGGNQGGHGVGLFEEGSGAAVWTQYMHGKDEATDMPMDGGATSYESNYDGIVLGVDFKKVGKFQSGVAFNYGEGDSTGFTSAAKTKSDYDFWGIGYYGNIRNEDTNFIFDVNYAKSDSDVTQNNAGANAAIEASPETTTWSAGVKVEKLYQNNNVQIVPYTGLRYMSIDTDEYTSKLGGETLFNYAPERQDIWLLPLGVTIKQEVVNDNGWVVTPKVDLSYVWAFGDTDSNMSVSIPGIAASNDTLGFTVMDDGSFIGLVGIEATMDDWTFGVSYSYQKGDYAESKKWFVDAKYSF